MDNHYEDPIEEVYRIRQELLEEYGGIKGLNKHLDEVRPKYEAMGFRSLTEEECNALRNRH
ncbi:MAG: hypothetical protein LBC75_00710 [Fibromonadaceae bacterium]|jgi:hypothetical protein|nr:hypothetical protein [Fibromonadaceae bacterium]